MISFNVLERLAKIRANEEGTGLIFDRDNHVFLITAAHVVEGINVGSKVHLALRRWKGELPILQKENLADVSVLRIGVNNAFSGFDCNLTIGGLFVGQDMFVAGFPHGWEIYKDIQGSRELFPFIKKTTIANLGDGDQLYIDTKVNRGFSGAPLFFNVKNEDVPRIAGIVSSYCKELEGFSICYNIKLASAAIDVLMSEMR